MPTSLANLPDLTVACVGAPWRILVCGEHDPGVGPELVDVAGLLAASGVRVVEPDLSGVAFTDAAGGQPASEAGYSMARVVALLADLPHVPGATGMADGMPDTQNPRFREATERSAAQHAAPVAPSRGSRPTAPRAPATTGLARGPRSKSSPPSPRRSAPTAS